MVSIEQHIFGHTLGRDQWAHPKAKFVGPGRGEAGLHPPTLPPGQAIDKISKPVAAHHLSHHGDLSQRQGCTEVVGRPSFFFFDQWIEEKKKVFRFPIYKCKLDIGDTGILPTVSLYLDCRTPLLSATVQPLIDKGFPTVLFHRSGLLD